MRRGEKEKERDRGDKERGGRITFPTDKVKLYVLQLILFRSAEKKFPPLLFFPLTFLLHISHRFLRHSFISVALWGGAVVATGNLGVEPRCRDAWNSSSCFSLSSFWMFSNSWTDFLYCSSVKSALDGREVQYTEHDHRSILRMTTKVY